MCKVLTLRNIGTVGPKLNYESSLIVVDDLSMPDLSNNNKQNLLTTES